MAVVTDQVDVPPSGRTDADARETYYRFILGIHGPLMGAVRYLQPLVVLFSVSIVLATFTKASFPDASDWSLIAAFGFGWALVFSAAVAGLKRRAGFGLAMIHLHVLFGVLLGFLSLGLALVYMLLGSDLLHAAILFIVTAALSLASFVWFFETWTFVRVAYRRARQEDHSGLGWLGLGWANAAGLSFAVVGPGVIFYDPSPSGVVMPLVIWLVGLVLVALARGTVTRVRAP